jgi:hypothetical protein
LIGAIQQLNRSSVSFGDLPRQYQTDSLPAGFVV